MSDHAPGHQRPTDRDDPTYHVVCHDCPFEAVTSDERYAAAAATAHPDGHAVEYAEVSA
jgi:hypothetical protein